MSDVVKTLVDQGKEHFEGARILLDQGYPTDVIGLLLHQSLEAYFKGLMAHWELDPEKDEDLKALFDRIVQRDGAFKKFKTLCDRVNGYYTFGELPADPFSQKAGDGMKTALSEAEHLIGLIEQRVT